MMFGKRRAIAVDKDAVLARLEGLIETLRVKRELVEPSGSALDAAVELRRESALWIDRAVQKLRDGTELLRISLPNARKERETQRELASLLTQLGDAADDATLIWSSAKERLYPLAVSLFETVETYCTP